MTDYHCGRCAGMFTRRLSMLYLSDQQLNVLLEAVQESLQGAGVGSAALPSADLRQSSMFVSNLG